MSHLLATNLDNFHSCGRWCPSNLQEKLKDISMYILCRSYTFRVYNTWKCVTKNVSRIFLSISTWKNYFWAWHHPGSLCTNCRVFWLVSFNGRGRVLLINWRWSVSNDATHINICNLMGITYIVYWSGHFSKKAAKIFLRCTTVMPFVTALGTTDKTVNEYCT